MITPTEKQQEQCLISNPFSDAFALMVDRLIITVAALALAIAFLIIVKQRKANAVKKRWEDECLRVRRQRDAISHDALISPAIGDQDKQKQVRFVGSL